MLLENEQLSDDDEDDVSVENVFYTGNIQTVSAQYGLTYACLN